MFSVSASGLSQLIGGLTKAARVTPAAALAVRASGEVAAEAMREDVAVDSGATRDSIGVDHSGLSAAAGPTTPWAGFLEWGTYKDAPQPFTERAAQAGSDDLANKLLLLGVAF